MTLADNTLHPLEVADARDAAFRASEKQREVEDAIREASRDLAEKERAYRKALSIEMTKLHADGVGWSTCYDLARGEKRVADLRYNRDVARGVFEASQQQAFRRGADRKDVNQLLQWSQARDLRTDAPPAEGAVQTFGARRAA